MKQRTILFSLVALIAFILAGCATVNKGTTQTVLIKTDQPGASVFINGELMPKTTPIHVELARGNSYTVDVKKDGFADVSLVIMPVPNEYEDNLFRWGFDYQSGSMTDLTPREIDLKLTRK